MNKKNALIFVFYLTFLLWILRMVLPGIKYLFIPSYTIFLVLTFVYFRKGFLKKVYLFEFSKTFYPLFILVVFYLVGVLISGKIYLICKRDILEFVVVLTFLYVIFLLMHQVSDVNYLKRIFKKIVHLIGIFSLLIAVLGITKFIFQLNEIWLFKSPFGTSINTDTNFYSLFAFLGIISFIPSLTKRENNKKNILNQFLILILILNIVFSYSYRSLFLLGLMMIFLVSAQLIGLFGKSNSNLNNLNRNLRLLFFITVSSVIIVFAAVKNNTSLNAKLISGYNDKFTQDDSNGIEYQKALKLAFKYDKWEYALEYFSEQKFINKVFGSGFLYLEKFGEKFHTDSTRYDYPHNPVLSSLLYSGLIGALFLLSFLLISLYYGFVYLKKYPLFSLMLLISSLFVFFSGNSILSIPVFLFLFSVSFLIRHQEITDLNIEMNLHKPGSKFLKEIFDYVVATVFIILISPVLFTIVIIVLVSMGWPVIYSQNRVGQNGKMFHLHKFRTMKMVHSNTTVAAKEQNRITKTGSFLRKTKLDELPELWNIIRGDMSFVGPRPDVPGYADKLNNVDKVILQLKPGLTGAASLKYMDEEEILQKQTDPQKYNDDVIFPDKVRINKEYMKRWSMLLDIKIILFTGLRKKLTEEYFQ